MDMELTVVVAVHRRPVTLRETLESILKQKEIAFDTVVVSGVAEPEPVDDVMKDFPTVRYVKDEKYLSLSAKHVYGFETAKTDYVYTIDDDDYLTDDLFFRKACDILDADAQLAFVSASSEKRIESADGKSAPTYEHYALPFLGRRAGREYFQDFQVTMTKPLGTCTTVWRRAALLWGEPLREFSDSSMYLKALLWGDCHLFADSVAHYRVWKQSMTNGRGSNMPFKINVMEQKERFLAEAMDKIPDPLGWWFGTYKMNYLYFESSFANDEDRKTFAKWGYEHAHGSEELKAFCAERM